MTKRAGVGLAKKELEQSVQRNFNRSTALHGRVWCDRGNGPENLERCR
jgi:hypothetical protein